MKTLKTILILSLLISGVNRLSAQGGVSSPLGIYGVENSVISGARSRAMGWSSIANAKDASALFGNPALLTRLKQYEIRGGGISSSTSYSQHQEWYPDKVYATLSLLLEDRLPADIDTGANVITLERKYDDIGPNWEEKKSRIRPSTIVGAVPFEMMGMMMTVGIGYTEMLNLDHYFQNNSAMDPYIGSFRPAPYPRPVLGDTTKVNWFQYIRSREGSVYGIVPALSAKIMENLSVGISVTILDGTSDDLETRRERGFFRFATSNTGNFNVYFVDSVYYRSSLKGTSTYSGAQTSIGLGYEGDDYSLGVIVKPGYTLTRKYSGTLTIDTTGNSSSQSISITDKVNIPLTYAFGGAFSLSNRLRIAVDYLINSYSKTEYIPSNGSMNNPWLDGEMFRVGVEFDVIEELALQCGYRENTQVFAAEGASIVTDPVHGSGYTAGFGLMIDMVSFNVAYEYTQIQYDDKWISNINYNKRTGHSLVAEFGVRF